MQLHRRISDGEGATYINSAFNYVFLGVVSLLFWGAGYMESIGYPIYATATSTPIWEAVCRMSPSKEITYLSGVLLLFGGAFLIHQANYMLIIIRKKTYLPFLLYIIFISSSTVFFPLTPASVGIFCLIFAMSQTLSTYNNPRGILGIYNAALLIGIGSLLWIHILWFVPVFWWGMYSFKSLSLRTLLASLIGLGTVYWFLLGWCVFTDDYRYFLPSFTLLGKIALPHLSEIRLIDWLHLLCLLILALATVLHIIVNEYEENIRTRHFLFFIIAIGLVSFGFAIIYEQEAEKFLQVSCMPLAILAAHFFSTSRMKRIHWMYIFFISLFLLLSILRSSWGFLPPDIWGD
ncbi:MAG: hypothetical protein LBH04_07870 [Tannerellaceae bacterium]|jgi:hypothetical protein|nr:hypothetical protein [Tannerellaceae bacterium]